MTRPSWGAVVAVSAAFLGAGALALFVLDRRRTSRRNANKRKKNAIPPPKDLNGGSDFEAYYRDRLMTGEALLAAGDVEHGAKHLALAVALAEEPETLLKILQEELKFEAFSRLVDVELKAALERLDAQLKKQSKE